LSGTAVMQGDSQNAGSQVYMTAIEWPPCAAPI